MVKKFIYTILSALFLLGCNEDSVFNTREEMTEISLSVQVGVMDVTDESRSQALYSLPDGAEIGLTVLESESGNVFNNNINVKYTDEGVGDIQSWKCETPVTVGNASCEIYSYYPYNASFDDMTSIPVSLDTHTDYLVSSYPATGISNHNPSVNINMKHVLSFMKVVVKKNNFPGNGIVTELILDGNLYSNAKLDLFTGNLSGFNDAGPIVIPANETITGDGAVIGTFLVPDNTSHNITGTITVDNTVFSIPTTAVTLEQGKMYTLTVTINGLNITVNSVEIESWKNESLLPQTDYVLPNLKIAGNTDNIAISAEITSDGRVCIKAMPTLSIYKVNSVSMSTDGATTKTETVDSSNGSRTIILNNLNAPTTLTFSGTSIVDNVLTATYNVPSTRSTSVDVLSSHVDFDVSKIEKMFVDGRHVPTNKTFELPAGTHTVHYKLAEPVVPDHMFHDITTLNGFSFTSNINTVGTYSFAGCTGLSGTLTIPTQITSIGDYAYMGCTEVEGTVSLNASITNLGRGVFKDCTSITEANILCPMMSEELFSGCTALNAFLLSGNITGISDYAFYGCTSLTSINIPITIETIGNYSFGACSNLNEIECGRLTAPAISSTSYCGVSSTGVLSFSGGATGYDSWISETEGYLNPDGWTLNEKTSYYTVDLNGQWRESSVANPDATLYDGVYESNSNYNVNNGYAYMYIKVFGYETFTIYIRSYAESSYDYVMASTLDSDITGSTSYSDTSLVAGHTRSKQSSSTAISGYQKITYTLPDKGSEYTIKIVYRKDGSSHSGTDRGYLLIEKQ